MIKVKFYNDAEKIEDISDYAREYEFKANLFNSYYDIELEKRVDLWILEGEQENIEAFINDYCLEKAIIYF